MKKSWLCLSLVLTAFLITGCKPMIMDGDGMVKPDNQIYCENRGWDYIDHNYDEGWDGAEGCRSSISKIFCPIEDIKSRECGPGFELDFVNSAFDYCKENGGTPGEDYQENGICVFNDEYFCYADDYYLLDCKSGDNKLDFLPLPGVDDYYPYAEQACYDSNGQLSENEDGEEICILDDENNYCLIEDIINGRCDGLKYSVQDVIDIHEEERAYQEYVAECYEEEQETVCGKDGNPYYNRCFMEKAGVEEETELAEVVSGQCIYG